MPWVNGKFVPDIPAPPPPRVPGGGATTLPQNNNRTYGTPPPVPSPNGGGGLPPPPPPTPPPPRPPGSGGGGGSGAPPPQGGGGGQQWTPDQIRNYFMSQASSTSGTGFNDTFNDIDNNTMQTWIDKGLWDQQNKRWRPEDQRSEGRIDYSRQTDYKPTDCPAGETPLGTNGPCTPNDQFDPTTGAFVGPGGGGGGGRGGGGAPANQPYLDEMNEYWKNLVKNQDKSRYSPEAMAAIEADQFARARAQEKNQLEEARADMAQRGVTGSANQNATMRGIRSGTGAAIMQNRAQVVRAKIDADYQDKQAAINNAKEWVNSMRDYMLRTDMNAIQREQIAAQIRLANMNIDAQSKMLEQQYQNNLSTYLLTNGG